MSTPSTTPGIHLQDLVLDSATTSEQKTNCLKLMKVVVKNLFDSDKNKDEKYRQLKLDNQKVRDKLLTCKSAVDYLKAIGFVETTSTENTPVLRVDNIPDLEILQTSMEQLNNALQILLPKKDDVTKSNSSAFKHPIEEKLSEKQRARRLLEEKERRERDDARAQRKRNIALLKQDKFVRENDQNWKSGPSAACAKAGSSISTFRDRHGEN
mmetsp:Transcript_2477/g.3786  ORF Transcript_2477/g.3786 Transcript_2477/m.3786 type:complete len:211 (+) Transcript_2477:42-674(+)